MIFIQVTLDLGWTKRWQKGDVTTAFLQGQERDVKKLGKLYLEPPARMIGKLEGVEEGALFEVVKSVYGLPDAPRAWWNELTSFLTKELGFVHHRLDVAFLIWYHSDHTVGIIMIVHVDDIVISHDESALTKKVVDQFRKRFQFSKCCC